MMTDDTTHPCPAGDLRLNVGWPDPFTAKGTEMRRVIDSPKDAPVRQGKGWAAHTSCSTSPHGNCGKVGFAR